MSDIIIAVGIIVGVVAYVSGMYLVLRRRHYDC